MALPLNISDQYRTKFAKQWDAAFEQTKEHVRPFLSIHESAAITGDSYEIPRLGTTEVHEFSGNKKKMEEDELKTAKTTMRGRQFYNYVPISRYDQIWLKDLEYGFGQIRERQAHAAARFMDQVALGVVPDKEKGGYRLKKDYDEGYLGGILNVRYSGNGGLEKKALDLEIESAKKGEGNLIAVDYAMSGTGVSANFAGTLIDRLEYAKRRMEETSVFDGTVPGDICVCISPAVRQMLKALEIKLNRHYGFKELGNEGVATFVKDLNMTFLVSNMLPLMDTKKLKDETEVTGCRACWA